MQWPARRVGRQQRMEHVGSEELAHGKGTICRARQVEAYLPVKEIIRYRERVGDGNTHLRQTRQ